MAGRTTEPSQSAICETALKQKDCDICTDFNEEKGKKFNWL